MSDRGKGLARPSATGFADSNHSCYHTSSSHLPCRKHPASSTAVGICAYCLKDRLVKLVCSDCGEQRLSSCSCSDFSSSNRNSRISFLIDNELPNPPRPEVILLRRSNSSCVDAVRRRGGAFWGKVFGQSRENRKSAADEMGLGSSETCALQSGVVPRSRSLRSFRGGEGLAAGDAAPSRGANRRVFSLRDSDFGGGGTGSGFIDLKLGTLSSSDVAKPRGWFAGPNMGARSVNSSYGFAPGVAVPELEDKNPATLIGGGVPGRVLATEGRSRKSKKSAKVWSWIFGQ